MPRITLQRIADEAKLHVSSVSLALRNHPRIPEETRARIRVIADKLGYRPDPVLGALVAYRQSTRAPEFAGVIAWLDVWGAEGVVRQRFPEQWAGASARAKEQGWQLEEFSLPPEKFSGRRTSQILHQRGIAGIILPPMPRAGYHLDLDWGLFAAVSTSQSLASPRIHHTSPDQIENMRLCLRVVHERGYRRVGLVLSNETNNRTRNYFSMALMEGHESKGRGRMPRPLIYGAFPRAAELRRWLKTEKPDVIVTENPHWLCDRLAELKLAVPGDIGVVGTSIWERPQFAGINENHSELAGAAVDVLTGMVHRNEHGLPRTPLDVRVPGFWNDAPTLRAAPVPAANAAR